MDKKKIKIKNILILVLAFILGFGAGMVFTFQTVLNRLGAHGVSLW